MVTIQRVGSLNQEATAIADVLGKSHEQIDIERIKLLILEERANRIRQSVEKYRLDSIYNQRYVLALEETDTADSSLATSGIKCLRTSLKVARPIRIKSEVPFPFVGSIDGKVSFGYTEFGNYSFLNLEFSKSQPRYSYINDYIYVYNNNMIDYISAIAPYENPELIIPNATSTTGINYTDDMALPIPYDMMNSIKEYIIKALSGINPPNTDTV